MTAGADAMRSEELPNKRGNPPKSQVPPRPRAAEQQQAAAAAAGGRPAR